MIYSGSRSVQAFTQALFNLALRPELIKLLRDEAEPIIQEEGWTKAAMGKLRIMDSFMKESQRVASSAPGTCRSLLQKHICAHIIAAAASWYIAHAFT
jgi:cytochrome P450